MLCAVAITIHPLSTGALLETSSHLKRYQFFKRGYFIVVVSYSEGQRIGETWDELGR